MELTNNEAEKKAFEWLENMPGGVFVYRADESEEILYSNRQTWELFACHTEEEFMELTRGNFNNLVYAEDLVTAHEEIKMQLHANGTNFDHIRYRILTKDKRLCLIEDYGRLYNDPVYGKVFIVFISETMNKLLPYAKDTITDFYGMGYFLQHMERLLKSAVLDSVHATYNLISFNIINFKFYNVKNGTKNGDMVLSELASMIRRYFPHDLVSRTTEDHFLVLTSVPNIIDRIRDVHDAFSLSFAGASLGLKAGIYEIADPSEDIETIYQGAEIACDSLYDSIDTFCCFYKDSMRRSLEISEYVIREIDNALEKGYIKIFYQPVVRTISGALCGFEALARWDDPELGLLSPAYFITALEDSHQIHKLDLYVVEEVCRQMREFANIGKAVVPVSFNLSRLDFTTCDIFSEVEERLKKYDIPRDMLRVEITESMMVKDAQLIHRTINKFQNVGYKVWMDDFGSGYSSLNLLKDYDFDEIKLDMVFLSSFNERTKDILKSLIGMAKKIGIQTLAEGVEDKEQYEFLKSIGCEKVQGYFFGKPMPLDQAMAHCKMQGLKLETRSWQNYYDKVGRVNFVTDRPLALIEFADDKFRYLFYNDAYVNVLKSTGATGIDEVHDNMNSPMSPLTRQFRIFENNIKDDEVQVMDYTIRGQYVRAHVKRLCSNRGKAVYQTEIMNLTKEGESEQKNRFDKMFRMMYMMYDAVFVIELDKGKVEPILQGAFYRNKDKLDFNNINVWSAVKIAADKLIYEGDRKEYLEWLDESTIERRITESNMGYITNYFRTKEDNGSYVWKAHHIMFLPGSGNKTALYSVIYAPLNRTGLLQKVAYSQGIGEHDDNSYAAMLWRSLIESNTLDLFWKDAERKFVGANRKFLDFYGMSDVSDIVGKTDEQMHWHIDNSPFYNDEVDVLTKGETTVNRVGKCIVKGVVHDIIATKTPMYENGKIVGLLGYFTDIDEILKVGKSADHVRQTDIVTGLMNTQGLMNVIIDYVERWEAAGESYALIRIGIRQYLRTVRSYGEETARLLLQKVSEVLLEEVKSSAACARIYSGNFVLCMKYTDSNDVEELVQRLNKRIGDIHSIGDCAVTIIPETKVIYADRGQSLSELMGMVIEAEKQSNH